MIAFAAYLLYGTALIAIASFMFGFMTAAAECKGLPSWLVEVIGIVGWVLPFATMYALTR